MAGSAPVLWVSGGMGTGKTHLAADLVNFLRLQTGAGMNPASQTSENRYNVRTAFYFCGKSASGVDSSRRILDTLVWQLACRSGPFFDKAVSVYDEPGNPSSRKVLWERLLRTALETSIDEEYVLVIDGLDEVNEAALEGILQQLEWLRLEFLEQRFLSASAMIKKPRLRIVVLGRPSHDDRVSGFFQQELETIEIFRDKSAEDLEAYIKESIDRSRELREPNISIQLKNEIIRTLEEGADGSFLWVKLKVKEISQQSQVARIRAILRIPSAKLGEQLEKTLHSLSGNDNDAETLSTILAFTTWFEERIYLEKLAVVPKLKSTEFEDEHGFMGLEDLLVVRYRPLFRLQRDDGLTRESLLRR